MSYKKLIPLAGIISLAVLPVSGMSQQARMKKLSSSLTGDNFEPSVFFKTRELPTGDGLPFTTGSESVLFEGYTQDFTSLYLSLSGLEFDPRVLNPVSQYKDYGRDTASFQRVDLYKGLMQSAPGFTITELTK